MSDDAQKKKSRSRAFRNPMRLADEHAAMLELLMDVFLRDVNAPAPKDDSIVVVDARNVERARALITEVDKP